MNEQREKLKVSGSIQTKILLLAAVTLLLVSMILTAFNVSYIRRSTTEALQRSMSETARVAADRVADHLSFHKDLVASLASRVGVLYYDAITQPYASADIAALEKSMANIAKAYGYDFVYVIDKDGMSRTARHSNIAELAPEYYTRIALDKEVSYVSGVSMDQGALGAYVINYAAPITDEDGEYMGVLVCKANAAFLSELMSNIRVGAKGSTFVMNNEGLCIAHPDSSMMFGGEAFTAIKDDPQYASLNALWDKMESEDRGFTEYTFDGARFAAFDTVAGSNNWTIAITADKQEFMSGASDAMRTSILIALALSAVAFLVCYGIVRAIVSRITNITQRLERLSHGDLAEDVEQDDGDDEVSRLTAAARRLITEFHSIIDSIGGALSQMAEGNLNAKLTGDYPGDFMVLKTTVERNMEALSGIVEHISRTSEEVSRGSAQIADGATSLAQGAAEQAGSVEELHAVVLELSQRARDIADPERRYLDESGENDSDEAEEARVQAAPTLMDKLVTAMSCIEERLREVRKISGAIERVSSDTGMLALNAAVEASHAGEYGKGFAVIAAEIRELSEKSRQEARNADAQVDQMLRSVDRGSKVMGFTVESVQSISLALSQVESTLSQISGVIEGTAATAEESAAGSEELSAQAEVLRSLASGFTIWQSSGAQADPNAQQ